MAFGIETIIPLVGLIVGIIIGVRLKKVDVMDLLAGWGIFILFGPALGVLTVLVGLDTNMYIGYLVSLISFFGLGVAIWILIKKFIGFFQ